MVLVAYKPINIIVLASLIVMGMHFLQAGGKRATRRGMEEPMITMDFITALFYAILRTFFERKGLTKEARTGSMWLSNATSTGERPMTIVHDILKQMPALGQPQRKFLATLFV